jgi:fatty-acyl-CoA synthase
VWVHDPRAERFGYWNDEAKTASAWRDDAFGVGDLGWVDADGYLFLTSRKHDTIITGGVNVYPQEVEAVLAAYEGVADAMVFGAPNEEWGQEVRAHVVEVAGAEIDLEELRLWARERLAGYKVPRHFELVDELPRTATGKVKRPVEQRELSGIPPKSD